VKARRALAEAVPQQAGNPPVEGDGVSAGIHTGWL
jgi:hypothetical protein